MVFKFDLAGSRAAYEKACPERVAKEARNAELRARAEAASERRKRELRHLSAPVNAKGHIEASGWACSEVMSVAPDPGGYNLIVHCSEEIVPSTQDLRHFVEDLVWKGLSQNHHPGSQITEA